MTFKKGEITFLRRGTDSPSIRPTCCGRKPPCPGTGAAVPPPVVVLLCSWARFPQQRRRLLGRCFGRAHVLQFCHCAGHGCGRGFYTSTAVCRYWDLKAGHPVPEIWISVAVLHISCDKGPLWIWSCQAASAPCLSVLFSTVQFLGSNLLHFLVLTVWLLGEKKKDIKKCLGSEHFLLYFLFSCPCLKMPIVLVKVEFWILVQGHGDFCIIFGFFSRQFSWCSYLFAAQQLWNVSQLLPTRYFWLPQSGTSFQVPVFLQSISITSS